MILYNTFKALTRVRVAWVYYIFVCFNICVAIGVERFGRVGIYGKQTGVCSCGDAWTGLEMDNHQAQENQTKTCEYDPSKIYNSLTLQMNIISY